MENFEKNLREMVLTPYIVKATALIGKRRYIGGNAFRHQMNTMSILMDYKYSNPVIIKSSIIHDLIEDIPSTNIAELRSLDSDANEVVNVVLEVTRRNDESKPDYLERVLKTGSEQAKTVKCADRISNIIDLNSDIYEIDIIENYILQTEKYILPMALEVNINMHKELSDLINIKKKLIHENTH